MIDFFLGPALGQEDLALTLVIAQNVALVIVIVLVAKRHFSQTTTTSQAHRAMARTMTATQPGRHKLLILDAPSGGNRGLPPLSERVIQNAGQRPSHRPSPRSGVVAAFFSGPPSDGGRDQAQPPTEVWPAISAKPSAYDR